MKQNNEIQQENKKGLTEQEKESMREILNFSKRGFTINVYQVMEYGLLTNKAIQAYKNNSDFDLNYFINNYQEIYDKFMYMFNIQSPVLRRILSEKIEKNETYFKTFGGETNKRIINPNELRNIFEPKEKKKKKQLIKQ